MSLAPPLNTLVCSARNPSLNFFALAVILFFFSGMKKGGTRNPHDVGTGLAGWDLGNGASDDGGRGQDRARSDAG